MPHRNKPSVHLSRLLMAFAIAVPAYTAVSRIAPLRGDACSPNSRYYYAEVYSNYSGGIDGSKADLYRSTGYPYNCDDTHSHTVESMAMFLPFNTGDIVENGDDRGVAGSAHGSCICPNSDWFFQYTGVASQGTSYLNVESPDTGGAHNFAVQEVVYCTPGCSLWAHYVTDVTVWQEEPLPAGDNPSRQAVINGEVYGDPTTQMGDGNWVRPQFHAGSWLWWNNKAFHVADNPYCNYDDNPGATTGDQMNFTNLGPSLHGC